jgi:hypothetical protein
VLQFKTQQLAEDAGRLGFTVQALERILQAGSIEQANREMSLLRKAVKRTFRRLALELHPDRTPDAPDKAEEFKRLSLAYDSIETFFQNTKVQAQSVVVIQRPMVRVSVSTGTSTSSTFTSDWWTRTYTTSGT